mmetsp:Transcript_9762/g.13252  ORF Transcript_9762/g.13252 Transcript_9762/m.13252 type:complete len:525 (-) Transcript_9762:94-1668(-)
MVLNEVSILAGSGCMGYNEGEGTSACFNSPTGVAIDCHGNKIVIDSGNCRIRKITSEGVVSTLAGDGVARFRNGQGTDASFSFIGASCDLDIDNEGNVIVADLCNRRIRKVSSDGTVSTLAGTGHSGYQDGTVGSALFHLPSGVAVDVTGNIFVSDWGNQRIRKISPEGTVSTFAGKGVVGFVDGTGTNATFNNPWGVAVDNQGCVFVSGNDHCIRKITPAGEVSTLAGNGAPGNALGAGDSACLRHPIGLAVDGDGNVIVSDHGNNRIVKVTSDGVVCLLAGNGCEGLQNGPGVDASFNGPRGLVIDGSGNVVVCDYGNHCVRVVAAGLKPPNHLVYNKQGAHLDFPKFLSCQVADPKFCDVEIHVGDQSFPALTILLRSPFFEGMFKAEYFEENGSKIVLKEVTSDVFLYILEYLYTDKLHIPPKCNVLGLHSAAEIFVLPDLKRASEIEISNRLCNENLIECLRYAKLHSMDSMTSCCIDMASKSVFTLTSVLLTDSYRDLVVNDPCLNEQFLKACQCSGK